jgi:hypothetical protein
MHAGKVGWKHAVRWNPPVLSFTFERHGAMAVDQLAPSSNTEASTSIERRLNANAVAAIARRGGALEGLRKEPIARGLADSIIAWGKDQQLKWQGSETVRELITRISPYG